MRRDGDVVMALKSFGDMVIAATSIARAPVAQRPPLAIGDHLLPLWNAIGGGEAIVVAHGFPGVPPAYDVRKQGYRRFALSLAALHRATARATPRGARLVFDSDGWRQRIIAGRRTRTALPAAPNIYRAYRDYLALPGDTAAPAQPQGATVGLFPGSRLVSKMLPVPLVAALMEAVAARGLTPVLWLLDGESPELEAAGLPFRAVPRSFDALRDAIAGMDRVISADSLPAHLAERLGVPSFVVSPVDNRYWLPESAFDADRWALFDEAAAGARLAAFLS